MFLAFEDFKEIFHTPLGNFGKELVLFLEVMPLVLVLLQQE